MDLKILSVFLIILGVFLGAFMVKNKTDIPTEKTININNERIGYSEFKYIFKSKVPAIFFINKENKVVDNSVANPIKILIVIGEKKTGGYSIKVNDIKIKDFNIMINATINSSEKNKYNTQSFTYPTIGIKLSNVLQKGKWNIIIKLKEKFNEMELTKDFTIK